MNAKNKNPRYIAVALLVVTILILARGSAIAAERVYVTDRLVKEFHLPDDKSPLFEQMKSAKPRPLLCARLMNRLHLL